MAAAGQRQAMQRALEGLLGRIDGWLRIAAACPGGLSQLLALQRAPQAGMRWRVSVNPGRSPEVADVQQGLQSMRVSGITVRQQACDLATSSAAPISRSRNVEPVGLPRSPKI
jgi:hypothetical protein